MNGKAPNHQPPSACQDCGGDNGCTKEANCWCMSKPHTAPVPAAGACRCERCFDRISGQPAGVGKPAG